MPSHFDTIGMPIQTEREFEELALRVVKDANPFPISHGRYLRWSGESGVELWVQQNRRGEIMGFHPHFAGTSAVRVGLTNTVKRKHDTPLDGALHAWANATDENPQEGDYPFVFDLPNFLLYPKISFPVTATAQIAAFAHELTVFESEETYEQTQTRELKFASKSFIPSGTFNLDGSSPDAPLAQAIFTGHVLRSERKVNELTQHSFYWAAVDTLGGVFDVVVSPELISDTLPVGGVVQGAFWLSGMLSGLPLKTSGFQKLWSFMRRGN